MDHEAILVVDGGPHDGETVPLGLTATLGRHLANEVVLEEDGVSRQHAKIVQADEGFHLRGLSSTNGTFVNSENIKKEHHLLKDGDSIRLGTSNASFIFHSPTAQTLTITLAETIEDPATQVVATVPPVAGDEEHYQGTVRLRVEGSMRLVMRLTERLKLRPDSRVLRMAKNQQGDTDLWLALSQPVSIRQVLSALEDVSHVSPTRGRDLSEGSKDPPLTVMLKAADDPSKSDPTH